VRAFQLARTPGDAASTLTPTLLSVCRRARREREKNAEVGG
jgi:hypothetical protein